jgi:hypothetical protein
MNTVILLAALLGPDAAPPLDPKVVIIDKILMPADEVLKNIDKNVSAFLDGNKEVSAQLPRGWKAEYLRLWKVKGLPRMHKAQTKHLLENLSLRELNALKAMKDGQGHPLTEKEMRQLKRKMIAFDEFLGEQAKKIGSDLGAEAELNLTK